MTCLGDVVAALVDGELDDAARERAHRHLAHCAGCRAEVDAQRRLKSRLSGTAEDPAPSDALTARLLGLTAGAVPVALRAPSPTTGPGPRTPRPASGPSGRRPARRSSPRRRATVGTALVALGLTAALALGGPPASAPSTPVDPGTDAFVVDFVSTSTSGDGGAGVGR